MDIHLDVLVLVLRLDDIQRDVEFEEIRHMALQVRARPVPLPARHRHKLLWLSRFFLLPKWLQDAKSNSVNETVAAQPLYE